ncbi:IclR family transcriptional regulator [Sphingobium xenophagum]
MRPRKEPSKAVGTDRDFVVALGRGLEILRAFRKEGEALGNRDFATRTGLSKSTISRLTYTLHRLGYLSYNPDTARYRLATPVLSLGYACLAGMPTLQLAKPYMQELANYSGMPVALAGRDRLTMLYLERCRGSNPVTLAIEVGAHIKLATTAIGRAYLAGISDDLRTEILEEIRSHEGESWPAIERGINEALECHARHGYCLSIGEWKTDVNSVAVPFIPTDGSPVMAFNCGGAAPHLSRDWIVSDIADRLKDLVRQVSAISP